jgi:adenylate cyclase
MGAQEIERKFLVWVPPADLDSHPASAIHQGYLAIDSDGSEVRLRRRDTATWLTSKRGHGVVRAEAEIEITDAQFETLWPLTEGRRLEKTRYRIGAGEGPVIELDVYGGALAGLVVAEVEFPSRADADTFVAPSWFGPDVSEDDAYKNQRLASDPTAIRSHRAGAGASPG